MEPGARRLGSLPVATVPEIPTDRARPMVVMVMALVPVMTLAKTTRPQVPGNLRPLHRELPGA